MSRVTWVRAGDCYPDLKAELNRFVALDEAGEPVGIVRFVESGPVCGRWLWSMTKIRPGQPFPRQRTGTTETRSQAAKALVATWREFWNGTAND